MSASRNGRVSQLQVMFARLEARLDAIDRRLSVVLDDHEARLRRQEEFQHGFRAWVALASIISGAVGAVVGSLLDLFRR